MDTFLQLFQSLPEILGPVLASLAGLIALDLGLAVAVAVRTGTFSWVKITAFYQTNVLPYGIAAVVIAASAQFISVSVVPSLDLAEYATIVGVSPMFAHLLLGSILPNFRALAAGVGRWEIDNAGWLEAQAEQVASASWADEDDASVPGEAIAAGEAELPDPVFDGPLSEEAPTPDDVLDELDAAVEAADIAALNEDGTAVDHYDPRTLAHVGSESVPSTEPGSQADASRGSPAMFKAEDDSEFPTR